MRRVEACQKDLTSQALENLQFANDSDRAHAGDGLRKA